MDCCLAHAFGLRLIYRSRFLSRLNGLLSRPHCSLRLPHGLLRVLHGGMRLFFHRLRRRLLGSRILRLAGELVELFLSPLGRLLSLLRRFGSHLFRLFGKSVCILQCRFFLPLGQRRGRLTLGRRFGCKVRRTLRKS